MLDKRVQVLLDERRYARLAAYAAERDMSINAAVRKAIDRMIPATAEERSVAARRILSADPMPVRDPAGLREELEAARARRLER